MHRNFLAMAPNYFGFGDTVEQAKAQLKKEGGTLGQHVVYKMPEGSVDPTVDGLGRISWTCTQGYDGPRDLEVVEDKR